MAQSTPITIPIAMQATDIHSVLTRPIRMLGQVRNSRVVDQSMRPMAKARIRNAAKARIAMTATIRP